MEAVINFRSLALIPFFLITACGESESIGEKLSADELEYLRARAFKKCLSATTENYNNFIKSSRQSMSDLARNDVQWTFKANEKTHDIYVWKKTSDAVYFRFRIKQTSGTDKTVYLKWSTTMNAHLMKSVQEDECAVKDYTATSSASSVTLKNEDKNFTQEDADHLYKNFRTFSYTSNRPSIFGLLTYTITKQLYDNDRVATGTPDKDTFTIETATAVTQPSTNYTSDVNYPNRVYCLVKSDDAPSVDVTYRKYQSVFTDITQAGNNGANLECDGTSDAPVIQVGGVDPMTFEPAIEL